MNNTNPGRRFETDRRLELYHRDFKKMNKLYEDIRALQDNGQGYRAVPLCSQLVKDYCSFSRFRVKDNSLMDQAYQYYEECALGAMRLEKDMKSDFMRYFEEKYQDESAIERDTEDLDRMNDEHWSVFRRKTNTIEDYEALLSRERELYDRIKTWHTDYKYRYKGAIKKPRCLTIASCVTTDIEESEMKIRDLKERLEKERRERRRQERLTNNVYFHAILKN